jgi:methionyl-tRNA formyltransferase
MKPIDRKPKTLLFGYGEYPLSVLPFLRGNSHLQGVVVPYNREGPNVDMVREAAENSHLRVYVMPPRRGLGPFLEVLKALEVELIVVYSFTMILPQEVLKVPSIGCINIHPGLLPEYRGPHVLNWVIINGEEKTGVTIHHMDADIDTGDIIARKEINIEFHDNARTLQSKLLQTGMELLSEYWGAVARGNAPRFPQDQARAKYYPRRTPEDGLIDWAMPAERIYNLVRALVEPWPGAYTYCNGEKITLWDALPVIGKGGREAHGVIMEIDREGIHISTGNGRLLVREAEYRGVKGAAAEIADIFRLGRGTIFSSRVHPCESTK